jgi:hypothetical protein
MMSLRRFALAPAAFASAALAAALIAAPALAAVLQQPPEEAARAAGGIHAITKDVGKIEALLKSSGWVSPHLKGKPLYMISFRSCPDCIRFETEQFPDLQKAKIDTRVIMVARRAKSTAPERTGVGELWATRSWKTYETWTNMPVDAWTGEGLKSGDADPARAALVEKGRVLVDDLRPLLAENGIELRYPTLIWKDAAGQLRGCACEDRSEYKYIRSELGLPPEG